MAKAKRGSIRREALYDISTRKTDQAQKSGARRPRLNYSIFSVVTG